LRFIKILTLLLLLAACAPVASESTMPPATGEPVAVTLESTIPPATGESTAVASEAATTPAAAAAALQFTSGDLVFTLESPADGVIVAEPQAALVGTTSIETILSVNDEIYILPAGQPFSIEVPLLEGPNALDIVASDYAGESIEFVLIVTYQP